MYISNKDIRARARDLLDENIFGKDWLKSVALNVLMILVSVSIWALMYLIAYSIFDGILNLATNVVGEKEWVQIALFILFIIIGLLIYGLLIGPWLVGMAAIHLDLERGSGKIDISLFATNFQNFFENLQLGLMYVLHILLWGLLLVGPGVYTYCSYAMCFYVKHDNPEFTWKECFDESERLMEGNRWRWIKLQWSFIGWKLLGLVAFIVLGYFWVTPYVRVSSAVFYDLIKDEKAEYDY